LGDEPSLVICRGKGKYRPAARRRHAGAYVLDFLPCFMGFAATAAARLVRSLSQALSSFCCLESMGGAILWFLSVGDMK
jgi:hypothetical protein